ncbi:ABC transporter permease subunit [Dongia sp.]|uniref:ABC transporter permease subunit n=1 Tax=Dongia sp. TaxID=1977262 RepID=UPI003750BF32
MNAILAIAKKEILDGIRNRWIVATTLLLAALALTLTFLGSAPTGTVGASPLAVTLVSLSSLSILLLPLIALLLSYDAICGEFERGTMLLLLSYPVSRSNLILGKFFGHLSILGFATVIGYGSAAIALGATGADISGWQSFLSMIGSSVLLGSAFLALGYLVSAAVADRGAAGGLAIGIWLLFVLIYDMALLGLLVVDQGKVITAPVLNALLLFNPADAYRVLNLTGIGGVSQFTGMAGVSQDAALPAAALLLALLLWTLVPLALTTFVLRRRQV